MKKTSFLLGVGLVVLLAVAAYTGYVYFQKYSTESDMRALDKSIETYKEELLKEENQQVLRAVSAREVMHSLRGTIVSWSRVIENIRRTLPVSAGVPLVDVLSYSGASERDISMNVRTLPRSSDPYGDVADLIEKFDSSSSFHNVFVSSISRSTDAEGNEVLSFPMRFELADEVAEVREEAPVKEEESNAITR